MDISEISSPKHSSISLKELISKLDCHKLFSDFEELFSLKFNDDNQKISKPPLSSEKRNVVANLIPKFLTCEREEKKKFRLQRKRPFSTGRRSSCSQEEKKIPSDSNLDRPRLSHSPINGGRYERKKSGSGNDSNKENIPEKKRHITEISPKSNFLNLFNPEKLPLRSNYLRNRNHIPFHGKSPSISNANSKQNASFSRQMEENSSKLNSRLKLGIFSKILQRNQNENVKNLFKKPKISSSFIENRNSRMKSAKPLKMNRNSGENSKENCSQKANFQNFRPFFNFSKNPTPKGNSGNNGHKPSKSIISFLADLKKKNSKGKDFKGSEKNGKGLLMPR